jgi:SAM-dependent methyltransferase
MPAEVAAYYASGDLLARLEVALRADGADPAAPPLEALAAYDQFHGRGIEATEELAAHLAARFAIDASHHLLDVGCGFGGPARVFARRFGCRVAGIDLTTAFCALARELNRRTGLDTRVEIHEGDALAMPFSDASFDGAYSMNVSMNIADKATLYRELHRALKPGAWLVLSELARGGGAEPEYPLPWAATPATSFLSTPEDTRRGLESTGFEVVECHDHTAKNEAYAARARATLKAGGQHPHRAIPLIHGDRARAVMTNSSRGVSEGRLIPIEIFARKTG